MLPEKPLLFESFTGLTVQQFDDIFDKEIKKNMQNMKFKDYQKEKTSGKEKQALEDHSYYLKNRFLMLLVYYRRYIALLRDCFFRHLLLFC
jgi:hypothetical protein